jgi:hypothetical protein
VSVDTVQRALDRLRSLGLLFWQRRFVRDGWRCEQTSNAYVLTPAAHNFTPNSCEPQIAAPVQVSLKKKEAQEVMLPALAVRQAAQLTLDTVRQRRMQALGLA